MSATGAQKTNSRGWFNSKYLLRLNMKKLLAKPMKGNYWQLLEIIKQQSEVIRKQVKFIDKLVSDNAEKENMINVLLLETANKNE